MKNVHFAIPEIYGESLSYYELLSELVKEMNTVIENYDTIPDQIAEEVKNLDASQLFSAVLDQLIHSIATDNTKSANAVKVYKKHDLLYATFNETVNLYESIIDFTAGTETELIVGTNIREVNISELFIELRKLIDINKNNIDAVTAVANENSAEIATIHRGITTIENKNTEQDNEITTIHGDITAIENKNTEQDNEITTIHGDITAIENKNTEQDNALNTLRTMLSTPYNFKGEVASISALPSTGNINDTYYVRDVKYKVTWTGSAWVQSSLSEADYQTELSELNGDLSKLEETANLNTLYIEKNCNPQGFYPADSTVKGLGFLMKNVPNFIHSIEAECNLTGNGIVKLDILDYSKNEIFSTSIEVTDYSSDVKRLIFNVNEYILEEKIWIRIYSETLGIGRCEPSSINKKVVDTSNTYAAYLVNGTWNHGSLYNYIPCCTIIGFSAKKSLFVGTNHKFTKIKDAVDYANEHINNEWDIFIESGTYDLYAEFGGDAWYSEITSSKGNMQGLSLGNNINIIGIGNVKLTLNAPDNLATSSNVPNLSVIELPNKNNRIENINIECKNVRYGIHDETDGGKPNSTRYFKNVEITHNGVVSGTWESAVSYGCGSSDNSYFEYENCKFNNGWLAHQSNEQTIPPNFIATNCIFSGGSYAISLNTSGTCKANITFNNCEINYMVRILEDSDVWNIYGSGNNLFNRVVIGNDKINSQPYKLYDLTRTFKNTGNSKITKGNAVQIYKNGVSNGNDAKQIIGIALNDAEQNKDVRVQLKGYYDCVGVDPFSENNTLLGVLNGTIIENTSNYFGIGVYVDGIKQIYLFK